jgi:hypothetical protein
MKKAVYMKMIVAPDWFIADGIAKLYDSERLEYKLLAIEQKFNVFIDKNDLSHFYELIFHYLNLNTLLSEHTIYSEYFKLIKSSDDLNLMAKDLVDNYDKGLAFDAIQRINDVYLRIFKKYLSIAIKYIGDIDIHLKNNFVHNEDQTNYIISNISSSNVYELWKVNYRLSNKLGFNMEKVENFVIDNDNFNEYEAKMSELNKSLSNPITSKNIIGLEVTKAINTINIMHLISCIMLLNKLFYGKQKFNAKVLQDLHTVVESRKMFPYKLAVNN